MMVALTDVLWLDTRMGFLPFLNEGF